MRSVCGWFLGVQGGRGELSGDLLPWVTGPGGLRGGGGV